MKTRILIASTAAAALIGGSAAAATSAFATTDLNLRAGPGPQHEIIGVIGGEEEASVEGCLAEADWCKVSHDGQEGWAYGEYLAHSLEQPVPIYSPESEIEISTVTYQETGDEGAAAGAVAGGALAAAAVGGPVAIVGGMLAGAGAGALVDVETTTVTYIEENPVDPIYAEGEVVVGAKLSDNAELTPVPDSEYSYIAVNNTTAVVDPETNEIVYILR